MNPGELLVAAGDIELNVGRRTLRLVVANTGDRPVQVGSHYHFAESNAALRFDRATARGFRLNIAAGTAVRFEPGQERAVELVALDGDRIVYGFNGQVMGRLDAPSRTGASSRRKAPPKAAKTKKATKAAKSATVAKGTMPAKAVGRRARGRA